MTDVSNEPPPANRGDPCSHLSKFEKVSTIGKGAFGLVYKAKFRSSKGSVVAVKRICATGDVSAYPLVANREIRSLRSLNHPNVVRVYENCGCRHSAEDNRTVYCLILEFCEYDLAGVLSDNGVELDLGEIKTILLQLFRALLHIHSLNIVHRDIKAANILINNRGVLKVADFGLSRSCRKPGFIGAEANTFTPHVITLWYRPPELLLGERNYNTSVDIWSAGCVAAELWTRTPIFQGLTEQGQLKEIYELCGSITPEVWPSVVNLQIFQQLNLPTDCPRKLCELMKPILRNDDACELLDMLLVLDPRKRLTAKAALKHKFFSNDPQPSTLSNMLSKLPENMFNCRLSGRGHRRFTEPRPSATISTATTRSIGTLISPMPDFEDAFTF